MLLKWYQKSFEMKDVGMRSILKQVATVKHEVREYILQNYIRQCKKKYAIAFLEWRLHFCKARRENSDSTQQEDSEVQELIDGRLDYSRMEFRNHIDGFFLSAKTLKYGAFETIKSLKYYGLDNPP